MILYIVGLMRIAVCILLVLVAGHASQEVVCLRALVGQIIVVCHFLIAQTGRRITRIVGGVGMGVRRDFHVNLGVARLAVMVRRYGV